MNQLFVLAGGLPIPAIAGGVCGVLVLAVIVAVSVLSWRRRRHKMNKDEETGE